MRPVSKQKRRPMASSKRRPLAHVHITFNRRRREHITDPDPRLPGAVLLRALCENA